MDQIMLQEQLSFDHKLSNITQTNQLLDQLQRKMNSYFNQPKPQPQARPSQATNFHEERLESRGEDDLAEGLEFVRRGSKARDDGGMRRSQEAEMGGQRRESQLQFKMYNNYSGLERDRDQKYINLDSNALFEGQEPKKQRERLSQTTVYKQSVTEGQNRSFKNTNNNTSNKPRRNNEQFRLLGKSKAQPPPQQLRQSLQTSQQLYKQNTNSNLLQQPQLPSHSHSPYPYPPTQPHSHPHPQPQPHPQPLQRSTNSLLHSMQTVQLVMKQALDAKLRKIKQIEHQIMTENQERVYLYKVNVKLSQELRQLEEEDGAERASEKNVGWTIKILEEDIEKIKKQINRKKNQRSQLRKQQKTLKDGYQTVLTNKKNILRKDIECYMEKQNKNNENTEMLKGLMKELDKLKGVVEAKIKDVGGSGNGSGVGGKGSGVSAGKGRKVVRSFKG